MTSVSSRTVVRLSSPGDIAAAVPGLCGFLPSESLVALSLRGRRRRLGLTMRLDLPPAEAEAEAAHLLAERVAQDGGTAAAVLVYGRQRRASLVEAAAAALDGRGIVLTEALHVHDGRWTSYTCTGSCCPPGGTALPGAPSLLDAELALDGRAVLASREDLVRSLAPPQHDLRDALRVADAQWALEHEQLGLEAARGLALAQARTALEQVAAGRTLDTAECLRLAVTLHDVRVRDEVATWSLEDAGSLLALTEQVVRQVGPPYDAPACTVLAWVAYIRGDGARANVALDRALRCDPAYSLALLLQAALDGAVPPDEVRRTMRATARALRLSSPG